MRAAITARTLRLMAPLLATRRFLPHGRHATPFAVSFLVTNRCQLRCGHCFYYRELAKPSSGELRVDEYERISRSMGRFGVGIFAGGEPFLRPDLAEIVNLFRANNGMPLAGISTNGQSIASIVGQTERMAAHGRRLPLVVSFSLEGPREVHDAIRGSGTFDRVMHAWLECARLARHHPNLLLAVTTVVSTLNQQSAAQFVQWVAAELRPWTICVLLVRQSPRGGEEVGRVSLEYYRRAQSAALGTVAAASRLGRLDPALLVGRAIADHVERTRAEGRRTFHCHAGVHGAVIDYQGNVNACEVLSEDPSCHRIGNLRDVDFDFPELWNSQEADRVRSLVNRHPACRACTHETVGLLPSLAFRPNRLVERLARRGPT